MTNNSRAEYFRARRAKERGGPARQAKDCATDGPSAATARRHQREGKLAGVGSKLLDDCPNGCAEALREYYRSRYAERTEAG